MSQWQRLWYWHPAHWGLVWGRWWPRATLHEQIFRWWQFGPLLLRRFKPDGKRRRDWERWRRGQEGSGI